MQASYQRMVVFVTWLAGTAAVLVALIVPLGYFSMSFSALSSATQTTAAIKGEMAGQIISSVPDMWKYQALRLEEALAQHSHHPEAERVVIVDTENHMVAQQGRPPSWPALSRSVLLFDSGAAIGRLEVSRSFRDLLVETSVAALAGLLLAAFIFLALRTLPLRLLNRTFDALAREKERAQVTLHSIGDAVITTDPAERIDYMNPVAEQLTGWRSEEACGQALSAVFHIVDERTGDALECPMKKALAEKRIVSLADYAALKRRDGQLVSVEDDAAPIALAGGDAVGGVLVFRDVTAARGRSQKLSWQASHDALTGLANRPEFERHLDDALESVRTTGHQHAMCYLDLDQFKIVNDTCGHAAGDELLRQVAQMFQQHVRESDLLARLGGDEFGVLLLGCPVERAKGIAANLLAVVQAFRFSWGDQVFSIGVSIGVVALTAATQSKEQIMSAADSACYAAKQAGRNRVKVYQPEDGDMLHPQEATDWASRITRAVDENRLVLYFQEYLPLTSGAGPGRHVEILLRMLDGAGNIIAPGAFIPAAERYDLMARIDQWVIATAFSGYSGLTKIFGDDLGCSINISGASLNQDHLPEFIREQAALHHVRADAICFEITESAAINQLRKASRFILDLKAAGFRFALDDFGAGVSSFAYLRNLAVDYLKIDGKLVREVATDPVSKAIVGSINEIGHAMGLKTIAEFVESEAILGQLRAIGVDFAQGYAIARPAPLPVAGTSQPVSAGQQI